VNDFGRISRTSVGSLLLALLVLLIASCTGGSGDRTATGQEQTTENTLESTGSLAPLVVETSSGRLQGTGDGALRRFRGVRYARPPTGELRWAAPQPQPRAATTVSATRSGPGCPQDVSDPIPDPADPVTTAEDCLFLDVTTPRRVPSDEPLPVMVWWGGGGFGTGAGTAYDPGRLVERGQVMVVTVNHRLGILGYLSLPGLDDGGTFGLADQILATRWAKDNAAAFGGDPNNITVFGESAGAISACAYLSSPGAADLVDRVAMSSGGSCRLAWPENGLAPGAPAGRAYLSRAEADEQGLGQADRAGCPGTDPLSCLRELPVRELLAQSAGIEEVPAYGTRLLPQDPAEAAASGAVASIPVLSSVNRDEAGGFVGSGQQARSVFTARSYPAYVANAYPGLEGELLGRYPADGYDSPALAWAALITDGSWICPTVTGNTALAANGSPVYAAVFADPNAPDPSGADRSAAAAHGSDLPYLFDLDGAADLLPEQQRLADTMIDYWSSFARTGVPGAADAPAWPAFTGLDGPTLQLRPGSISTVDLAERHHCSFWASL